MATHALNSSDGSDHSRSNSAMLGITNSSAGWSALGRGSSYWPSTRCPSAPSTAPTWAPISSGVIRSSMASSICAPSGTSVGSSPRTACSALAIRSAVGSNRPRSPRTLASTHWARRTARTAVTSGGGAIPVGAATVSSAIRTAPSSPRWSSRPHVAEAIPTCRASSQFTGPDPERRTRCISRSSGTSPKASSGMFGSVTSPSSHLSRLCPLVGCRGATSPSASHTGVKRVGDLAIDLGTANTLVYQEGKGIVYDEPSVIAMDAREGDVLAIGEEAWEMIGRTPSRIVAVRPLRRGAITDYDVTSQMIRLIFRRVGVTRFARPKALICVPSAITEVERRAVRDAATSAGARAVSLIEEPMGVAIGERAAEQLKMASGSAYPVTGVGSARIKGREITTGMPREIEVTPEEVREVLTEPVVAVINATKGCLAESDPELGQDVLEAGMFLTGGGSLLRGLDTLLAHECEVPVHLTDSPLQTVVLGAGKCLELMTQEAGLFGGSPWLR